MPKIKRKLLHPDMERKLSIDSWLEEEENIMVIRLQRNGASSSRMRMGEWIVIHENRMTTFYKRA